MNKQEITFLHLRNVRPSKTLQELADDLIHGPQMSSFGGITVAMKEVGPDLHYAVTRCRSDERYIKKEGRDRATARLEAPLDSDEAKQWRRVIPNITAWDFHLMVLEQGATVKQLLNAVVERSEPN